MDFFYMFAEDKKAAEDKATGDQAVKDTIYATAITCNKDGTIGNWKVYIYEKNTTATDEAACKAACTGADLESSKKCDFFIFKTSSCFLGDFSRGETTILADATSLGKPVDIQLKKGSFFISFKLFILSKLFISNFFYTVLVLSGALG